MRLAFGIIFSAVILAMAVCARIAVRSGKRMGSAASVLLTTLILPMVGNGIIILSGNRTISMVGCFLYYLGLDFSIAALLHFTFEYCQMTWKRKWFRNAVYSLFLVDVVQLLLNPLLHHAFEITAIDVDGFPYYKMIPHLGQTFHRAVDYLLLTGIILVFVIRMCRAPKLQMERYSVILLALLLVTVWETAYIFSGAPIDRSMIGFGVFGLLVFYFSLFYRPMRLLDRMLSGVVSGQKDPMFFFDEEQECIWLNSAGKKFLQVDEEDLDKVGNLLEATFGSRHPGVAAWKDQLTLERDGESRQIELSKEPLYVSGRKMDGFYIRVRDLTEEQQEAARKLFNARHDRLTGVYNRDYLFERTREILAENPGETYLVIYGAINDLKVVNDLYGNAFGDLALENAAEWLRREGAKRPGMIYGRLGGDSFGACLPEKDFSQEWMEESLSRFSVSEGGQEYKVLIHIGVYRAADRELEAPVMYDRALMALESIKDDYHFHIAWYDESMRSRVLWNRQISQELGAALAEGQIRPWLQPIVSREGKTIGAEALVRWLHPKDGLRGPGSFVPVFERNGMIAEVDRYIWRKSCEILARWQKEGKDLFLSVNISPKDFFLMDVPGELKKLVREYGLKPEKLRLEITETVMMTDQKERMEILRDLRETGFFIEMDDFGSGYSSLNLLREMPVDVLKIDMVFLSQAERNPRAKTIIRQMITLARELGIISLTEGVETRDQLDSLMEMGCRMYQGFYFAKPMPVEEFEKYAAGGGKLPERT